MGNKVSNKSLGLGRGGPAEGSIMHRTWWRTTFSSGCVWISAAALVLAVNLFLQNSAILAVLSYDTPTGINNDVTDATHGVTVKNCDESVLDKLDKRFDLQRSARQKVMNTSTHLSFDIYEPEATCLSEERFGSKTRYSAFGDGPKFICGVDFIARQTANDGKKCLVYSVGSNNNIAFEGAVHAFMKGCDVHTFDPTLNAPFIGDKYATFHPWGLGKDGVEETAKGKTWAGKSFETIIKELGHENRTIDVIKIDCEGCEYDTMPPLFELIASGKVKVNQVTPQCKLRAPRAECFAL